MTSSRRRCSRRGRRWTVGKRKADCTPEEWARELGRDREARRKWREANPEKARERDRKKREANPEKYRRLGLVSQQRYYETHKEEVLERLRKKREEDPEKARVTGAAWRKNNPEKFKEAQRARYAANPEKFRAAARKASAKLTDSYVANNLVLPVAECPPELIEMKREQLKLKRLTKQLETVIKEKKQ